jgi:hypothetical protein
MCLYNVLWNIQAGRLLPLVVVVASLVATLLAVVRVAASWYSRSALVAICMLATI